MKDFVSDNASGVCPEALEAIARCGRGRAVAYGNDEETERAERAFRNLFGDDARAFFVATGTAANTLAVASLTEPWQRVIATGWAHLARDESTAPERLAGCRVTTIATGGRKLTVEDLEREDPVRAHGVHHPAPGVVTISNPTEFGEVYTPEETAALAEASHGRGYRFHVDGARFANAVARLGCPARSLAVDAAADVLSLGGTKNGLALGEAVVFFTSRGDEIAAASRRFPFLRKSTGHLVSKHRYLSASFAAVLEDGAWLRHAAHANAMARRLSDAFAAKGFPPRFPTETNGVFVPFPDRIHESLAKRGWVYHQMGDPAWRMARFMTSFDTEVEAVDRLAADVAEHS